MTQALRLSSALLPLVGLALMLSISATLVLGFLVMLLWLVGSAGSLKAKWVRTELDVPLLILFIWALFTVFINDTTSFMTGVSSQTAFLFFYWAAHALNEKEAQKLLFWLCVGAVVAGLLGIAQAVFGFNYSPRERIYELPVYAQEWPKAILKYLSLRDSRAMGPRNHPLTYTECFIPAFFLLLTFLHQEWKKRKKITPALMGVLAAFLIVGAGVVLAQGRAMWLGLGVGILVFGWGLGRRFLLPIAMAAFLLFSAVFIGSSHIRSRFLSIFSTSSGSVSDQESKSIRKKLWTQALVIMSDHPFIGLGQRGARLHAIDPVDGKDRVWSETHNMFLQFGVELGVIGLGIFIWILVLCWNIFRTTGPPWRPAFYGMFAAFLTTGMTESWPHDKEVAMLFWTMIGCAAALRKYEKI